MSGGASAEVRQVVRALVLQTACLTTDDLMDVLAGRPARASVSRMRLQGSLLGMRFAQRGYLHPDFQIDRDRGRVHPDVARINRALVPTRGTGHAIRWWLTASSEVGGVAPAALLTSGRSDELQVLARSAVGEAVEG